MTRGLLWQEFVKINSHWGMGRCAVVEVKENQILSIVCLKVDQYDFLYVKFGGGEEIRMTYWKN